MQQVTETSTRYQTRYHMRYRTFSFSLTWLGHNGTRYHNFNVLPHAIPYIYTQFSMVWEYLQRVTTRYHQIYEKNVYQYLKKKNDGNAK